MVIEKLQIKGLTKVERFHRKWLPVLNLKKTPLLGKEENVVADTNFEWKNTIALSRYSKINCSYLLSYLDFRKGSAATHRSYSYVI